MMRLTFALLLLASVLGAQIRFEEISAKSNLVFKLKNGAAGKFHLVELTPGGVAAFDYDNDGCMDVFFSNGAVLPLLTKVRSEFSNRLFRNNCDLSFTDVTEQAGVNGEGYSMAVATADYDNDGLVDIFVAGVNRNLLYRNKGDGTFEDVTAKSGVSGIDRRYGKMWSISAGWFDAENDGLLDLFISNYVDWNPRKEPRCGAQDYRTYCHPDNYAGRPHQLFHNNGDGTFSDISASSGITKHIGKGMGVSFADFNRDGRTDVFVANDTVRSFLFQNQGRGEFQEVGFEAGVALGEHGRAIAGMGTDFRDYDNDGFPDVLLTGMHGDTYLVFHNQGELDLFEDYTIRSGMTMLTRQLTGWGMGLYDLDNDGHKDLFTANSHFPRLDRYLGVPASLPNSVFRNIGSGRFEDVSETAGDGFQVPAFYRGAAFADFDNDGRLDVVVTALNEPARLFRNVTRTSNHWIAVKLRGTSSNRDGLGAEVHVTLPDDRELFNHATASVGYASSSEPLVRFGLGSHEKVKRMRIRWPTGKTQEFADVVADQVLEAKEPSGS